MSTIINQDHGQDQDQNNDTSNSLAILVFAIIVIFVILFIFLGLPRIYNSTPIEINPSTVNLNPPPDILRDTPMDPVNPDNSNGGPLSTMPGTSIEPAPAPTPPPAPAPTPAP